MKCYTSLGKFITFNASGYSVRFDGYTCLYESGTDEEEAEEKFDPEEIEVMIVTEGDDLVCLECEEWDGVIVTLGEAFEILRQPLSPDHIVYCKAEPLFVEYTDVKSLKDAFDAFVARRGFMPKVVFVKGLGMFTVGATLKEATTAAAVCRCTVVLLSVRKPPVTTT